jgi:5-methylcytosine-specific restriction endonuclease McrA
MPKFKIPAVPRKIAFEQQQGRCYYCRSPIWLVHPDSFRRQFGLTEAQVVLLKCTAEHLIARSDGGTNDPANIVAACWTCNQRRHKRKGRLCPDAYVRLVRRRVAAGRWHWPSLSVKVIYADSQGGSLSA